ncbi:MAG: Fe-only nitrogenase subunit delta [Methanobacterium sp.]|jgi:nitrogenase delta subunit
MEDIMKERIEQLVDHIMKWSLWQFNSRAWDRENQNEGVLTKTMQILCNEPVEKETPADRCYWAEAVILAREFKSNYPWLLEMQKSEIKLLMKGLKDRIDYLTITGSLNEELTVKRY